MTKVLQTLSKTRILNQNMHISNIFNVHVVIDEQCKWKARTNVKKILSFPHSTLLRSIRSSLVFLIDVLALALSNKQDYHTIAQTKIAQGTKKLQIAVVVVISGLTCKHGEKINFALYWHFRLVWYVCISKRNNILSVIGTSKQLSEFLIKLSSVYYVKGMMQCYE